MVVYGRDTDATEALFAWLRTIDLRPQEWMELVGATGVATPYTGEVLDAALASVQAVVVFFTPDDLARLRTELLTASDGPEERQLTGQPRANVLYEAGLAFGRHPERTVLVEYGDLRGLSDLHGLHAVRLETGVDALAELAQRLKNAGCTVNLSGTEWLDASGFPARRNPSKLAVTDSYPTTSNHVERSSAGSDADPLKRLVAEILEVQVPGEPAEDVVSEITRRLRELQRPIRRGELFEGLPGRRLPGEVIRQTIFELERHGVLRRNPDERVRGYVLGELP